MNSFILFLATAVTLFPQVLPALPEVELIPEQAMGFRGWFSVREVEWNCSLEEWGKPVAVCRRGPGELRSDTFLAIAKEREMTAQERWSEYDVGKPGDGTLFFRGKPGSKEFVAIHSKRGDQTLSLRDPRGPGQSAGFSPALKGLPEKEQAVAICQGWMSRLGIDETKLARDPKAIGGFDVQFSYKGERFRTKDPNKVISGEYPMELTFTQKIGAYPSYRNSAGGIVRFELTDGGELATARYQTLSDWQPLGDYEILDRDEITAAVLEGVCWTRDFTQANAFRIDHIFLEAYQPRPDMEKKTHFPLVYRLVGRPSDAPAGAPDSTFFIPALRQHRDKYPYLWRNSPEPKSKMTLESALQLVKMPGFRSGAEGKKAVIGKISDPLRLLVNATLKQRKQPKLPSLPEGYELDLNQDGHLDLFLETGIHTDDYVVIANPQTQPEIIGGFTGDFMVALNETTGWCDIIDFQGNLFRHDGKRYGKTAVLPAAFIRRAHTVTITGP